jgi:hypothetical protein
MSMDFFASLRARSNLFERLDRAITIERAAEWFVRIADTYAPSQTARYTRGRVMREILKESGTLDGMTFHENLWQTGSVAVELGDQPVKPFWLLAHLDITSYALDVYTEGRYRLFPLCYHMSRGRHAAVALAFEPGHGTRVVATGEIVTGEDSAVFFETSVKNLPKGTRIVYHYPTQIDWNRHTVYGNIDNAFGATALLLAAEAIAPYRPDVFFAFPDEEEGQTGGGNQAFCKGSARLFHRCPHDRFPTAVLVCDVHESKDMVDGLGARFAVPGQGATYAELSSRGRGGVTPPPLVNFHHELARFLADHGVKLQENRDGYVSRSDSVSAMLFLQNIALIGYLGAHRHFDATPEANLADLVYLAKTVGAYALVAQDPDWQAQFV